MAPDRRHDPERQALALARWLGWATVGLGGIILTGWIFSLPVLRSLFPGQVEAKANTAVCFMLAGVALALKTGSDSASRRTRIVANFCAGLAAVTGLLTLAEYLFNWNAGIDELVFKEAAGAIDTVHLGRMAVPTALNFFLLGTAVVLVQPGRDRTVLTWLVVPVVALAGLAFVGQLYHLPYLASFGPFTPIAAPTGVAFVILSAGVLLAGTSRLAARLRNSGLLVGFGAAVLLLFIMGGAILHNTQALVRNTREVTDTGAVLGNLADTLSAMQDVETGARGYLLTGNPIFLDPYTQAMASAGQIVQDLRRHTTGNSVQQRQCDRLEALVERKIANAKQQVEMRRANQAAAAQAAVASGEGRRLMDAIRSVVTEMRQEENRLLEERQDRLEASTQRTLLTLGLGLTVAVGMLLTVFALLRQEIVRSAQSEKRLRRSEENLAVTLGSIGDAVMATDTAGCVTRLNPVAERLTGWAETEARGRPVAEVFRIIHEETRAPAPIPVDEVLATGEIKGLSNHTALIARDGTERAIADSAAPIRDRDGRVLGVVLVFRDVTETRRVQQELDRFFSLSLDFLCIASMDGYFKRVSPAVTDILGWTVEEFLARPYMEQIHPDDRAASTQEIERQTAGQKVMHFENRFQHKDGSWRVLSWRSMPQGDMMYATARDVTELKRTEEQIRQLNASLLQRTVRLEAANAELEAFSYSVSHDLRAPLRHVQGYVEMLTREAQDQLSEKSRRYLETITAAAREMGELIDDLLAFSRMGRTEMQEATVDLIPLVEETRQGLEAAAGGRKIRWTIGALPLVRGDAAMLKQVLANLLGNAVKYTRLRATAEIEIGCAGVEEGRSILFVRDNGAGFDMKYADKLFGVFQRLHRTDEFEGTGIGLASVRRIINRHGGRTWAEGRVDAGATFYFTLAAATAARPPIQVER